MQFAPAATVSRGWNRRSLEANIMPVVKILAIETSSELCSAALWIDGEVDAREALAGQRHSELLLPMIDALLGAHGLRAAHLDGIAYGAGPGSFTGLRIACGVAQGIAFGVGVPVVGIGTLAALAQSAGSDRTICCLDARMGEIYHAAYEKRAGGWHAVHEPSLCTPEAAPQVPGGQWAGCGSGFAVHRAALEQRYGATLVRILDSVAPHAREVASLAALEFARGAAQDAARAAPLYVRNKVALRVDERKRAAPPGNARSKTAARG
jgi:tRNA threonylcarbamoyladenosine biosynthesis protein TsaB